MAVSIELARKDTAISISPQSAYDLSLLWLLIHHERCLF